MDKVKIGLRFVWTYRFWFCAGLVLVFAFATMPSGTNKVKAQAKAQMTALEGIYNGISKLSTGSPPNSKWIDKAQQEEEKVGKVINDVWVQFYEEQRPLMTWPKELAAWADLPFGVELTTRPEEVSKMIRYQRELFDPQFLELWYQLNPIEIVDGQAVGVIDAPLNVITSAIWTRLPKSKEAWLAQEDLWVQRAIVAAIAKANKDAKSWDDARVRKLIRIGFGQQGLSFDALAKGATLIDGLDGDAAATASTVGGGREEKQNINSLRYIEKNEQYRVIPVFLSLLVDQQFIQEVLVTLSNADFRFTITQATVKVPEAKATVPAELTATSSSGQTRSREDILFNTMQLDVWATMRLYEMPAKQREEWEARQKAEADAKTAGKAGDAKAAAAPPKAGDAKAAAPPAPKAEAKPDESKE